MTIIFKTLARLTVAFAAAVGAPAFAAVQTVDAVGYTFSFDDGVWGTAYGTTFARVGDVLTFSNLGYDSASSVGRSGSEYSNLYDYLPITITAKTGYTLTGIVTKSTGFVSAIAGADPSAYAVASAYARTYWSTNMGSYKPAGLQDTEEYAYASAFAGSAEAHAYSLTDTVTFGNGEKTAVGTYGLQVWTDSYLRGSSALGTLDTASFAVAVSAVPEPETYAMLLAGLGLVGAVARRRRTATL